MKEILRKVFLWTKKIVLTILKREVEALIYCGDIFAGVGATAIFMLVGAVPVLFLLYLTGVISSMSINSAFDPFAEFGFYERMSICLTIGILEEGMFRYLLYDCILQRWWKSPARLALWISALAFGAVHFGNAAALGLPLIHALPQVVGAALVGFWMAYLYKRMGLHFAILTHTCYNFVVYETKQSNIGLGVYIVAIALGLWWLFILWRIRRLRRLAR
jgi:membrane protease YdiL (CAAX protease family)